MEDGAGIPEEFRCKRSDGKQWRCSARSMPDKTVCEKHYVQAKRRAANSAMRANEKKARRKSLPVGAAADDAYLDATGREDDLDEGSGSPIAAVCSSGGGGDYSGGPPRRRGIRRERTRDYSGRSTDSSGEAEGLTCHQCQRNDGARIVWCSSCDKRGYCDTCALRRYPNIPIEDIQQVCPACRGICNCRTCLRGDNLIKARIQEMSSIDKLRHLHRILSLLLPVLKQIHAEQCYELDLEIRVYGMKNDIPRAKLQPDEQMCCDSCKMPILDYHRHCTNCQFDLCLMCCQDLRRASHVGIRGELGERPAVDRIEENYDGEMPLESSEEKNSINSLKNHIEDYAVDFSHLFPKWKANSDDSIPCPRSQTVTCCNSSLVLRRILKINWVARLVKHAEEMVNGCKISTTSMTFESSHSVSTNLYKCSKRENSFDNFLYCPALQDIEHESISQFHTHWEKGEPVVIRRAFEPSLSACWDPMSIWRGIQEMTDDRIKEDDVVVKAIDCSNQSEVDIELRKFIKGYMDGCVDKYGFPEILKLKDWPSENDVEEFLLCQRPEFLSKLPLLEYFHPKWGLLNLTAKLPHDSAPSDAGPKFLIACGGIEENNYVSVLNLRINIGDMVYLLMHTSEGKYEGRELNKFGTIPNNYDESELYVKSETTDASNSTASEHCTNNQACGLSPNEKEEDATEVDACNGNDISPKEKKELDHCHTENGLAVSANAGTVWDVFRRQDVPKLTEYLKDHWEDLRNPVMSPNDTVTLPLYERGVVLDGDHKKRLKDELGIEPWTFEQHVGEAVFVPAGCPFQVRNRQSTVQLCLDFLSPESLLESARIAQEIRSLPSYHDAKLHMLEVGKVCLYAASSSIRDIQKIILDPKLLSDMVFEDRNLTAGVSENLERITKRKQIACL
ncbi:unnamed protein product [Spirodela intermedia]|uniref:Uncharacterized protein n=1 Tax=Spirodela intermedia TaxID=51605 RepID=A0A7I8I995_SPIIN|nr:unnamed protein product [Spirodela intermedia]CAA6654256.1 unnamed protein product [Spirodela intermedia]